MFVYFYQYDVDLKKKRLNKSVGVGSGQCFVVRLAFRHQVSHHFFSTVIINVKEKTMSAPLSSHISCIIMIMIKKPHGMRLT